MPKTIKDKFYQEFHIFCGLPWAEIPINSTIDWEWPIPLPRPQETPPSGTYWALEIHSITWYITYTWRAGAVVATSWDITTQSKTGKTPFVSFPGDPENIFFHQEDVFTNDNVLVQYRNIQNSHTNTAHYTDNLGHGKLVIPETIYVQNRNSNWTVSASYPDPPIFSASVQYTFTTVSCPEFLQEMASQLF